LSDLIEVLDLKRYWLIGLSLVLLVLFAYNIGFQVGKYSDWLNVYEPPMPTVIIDGKNVEVFRGSYSWSKKPFLFGSIETITVDALAPKDYIARNNVKPTVVTPGSKIESSFDQTYRMSLREFSLRKYQQQDQSDPYIVPKEKGSYIYEIVTRWRADQGEAIYFFVVEVK
jgi:hypothetical protein